MTSPSCHLVHTVIIPMRWADMDSQGHVNNVTYFRYMEEARVQMFRARGLNRGGEELAPDVGLVVLNASCSYLKSLHYPGDIEVRVFVGEPGRSSVMTWYEMRPSYDREVVYAEGSAKMCYVDRTISRSIPLPKALRDLAEGNASAG